MGNILSYLKWRGDISFKERSFGLVDNLVLSELAYIDFSGIIPSFEEGGGKTVREAAELLAGRDKKAVVDSMPQEFIYLLSQSRRFQNAMLSCYADEMDAVTQTQFSALHIRLEDGSVYVAFRGTGDEIVGWREDFGMSYQIMPAQKKAAEYLQKTMTDHTARYRIGGHSKGGNLAVYAALCCTDEKYGQIENIYSNDGPSLCYEVMDMDRYKEIRHRIIRIIPEFSLIGKLFEYDAPDLIVKSGAAGAAAHDGFTWEIEGDQFVSCDTCSNDSSFFNEVIDTWIESASMEQREAFTRDFFDALEAGGATRMSEITANGMDGLEAVMISLIRSENRTKIVIVKFLQSALNGIIKSDWKNLLRTKEMVAGVMLFVLGILIIRAPTLAGKCISVIVGSGFLFLIGKRLVTCAMEPDADSTRKQWKLIFYLVVICIVITLLNQMSFIVGFTEWLLSAAFLCISYDNAKKAFCRGRRKWRRFLYGMTAVFALLFGILPITIYALEVASYTLASGTFVLLYGVAVILGRLQKEGRLESNQ